MVHSLLKDLSKYVPFYKVALQDTTPAFQKTGFVSPTLFNSFTPYLASRLLGKNAVYTDQTNTFLSMPGAISRVILLGPIPDTLTSLAIQPKPFSYWAGIDIESGITSVMLETRSLFTPHHLNYQKKEGISFTKGCYTGQEIIARMHYLANLKQQLYKLSFHSDACPPLGTDIVDKTGKVQGTLVVATLKSEEIDQSTYHALAVIQNTAPTESLYLGDIVCDQMENIAE
jgi:hypothetical protein